MAPSYFDSSSSSSPSSSSSSSSEEDNYQGFQTTLQAVIDINFVNSLVSNVGNIFINNISNNQPEENDPPPRYTAQNTGPRIQAPPLPQLPPANTGHRSSLLNLTPPSLANTLSENRQRERNATRETARLNTSRPPALLSRHTRAAKPFTSSRLNQRPWTLREYKFISEALPPTSLYTRTPTTTNLHTKNQAGYSFIPTI